MRLNNWCVTRSLISPYLAPEHQAPRLHGAVVGSDKFPDNRVITTSPLIGKRSVDLGLGESAWGVVTRSGSVYLLNNPDEDYERKFPKCTQRLIDSLPIVP